MRFLCLSISALVAATVPASAITVTTPANGARLSSPFQLTASTATCDSKPAVSMGYSIDSGPTTIVSTSFNAMVSAPQGKHILHVKCWGQGVSGHLLLDITVGSATVPASSITVKTPTSGAQVASPFSLVASAQTCDSKPAVSMGYSIDSGPTTIVSTSFNAMVSASRGKHILHVKCWGPGVSGYVLLDITVGSGGTTPTAASPAFSPSGGGYKSAQSVTLSDATPGATIYYTTDGTTPTASSTRYSSAIPVDKSEAIGAIAVAPGYAKSTMAGATYVINSTQPPGPFVPSYATASSDLQLLDTWRSTHDSGTPGTAVGETSVVSTPSLSGNARKFVTSYTNAGGERFSVTYADDTTSMNFVYDGWVWIKAGSSIINLEMDSNQVTANGETVIYSFQCDGYSHVWDYSGAGARWVRSTQPCDVSTWAPNAWHHVQISYSRDDSGNVTYHSVWLDGTEQAINATVPSSFALGWKVGVVQTQFQMDGPGASGSNTLYLDNFTIYRW
jgi:hypothetical protein